MSFLHKKQYWGQRGFLELSNSSKVSPLTLILVPPAKIISGTNANEVSNNSFFMIFCFLVISIGYQRISTVGVSLLRSPSEGSAIPVTKRMKPAHTQCYMHKAFPVGQERKVHQYTQREKQPSAFHLVTLNFADSLTGEAQ